MKMTPRSKISLTIFLLIAFFVVLNLTNFSKEIKNFFYLISKPVQKTLWQTGDSASDFLRGIVEIKIIQEKNQELHLKNQELLAENVLLKELKKENEILREVLNVSLEKDFQLQLVQVISKDISQDSILVDKGLKDGVSKGLAVITSQKTLLGRIGKVYKDFAEVVLISNKESSFDAKVSEKEIYGIIRGKGSLEVYFDLIPKDKEIFRGDVVITAALGGIFPKDLLVGVIKEVKKSDVEPFQTATIESSFKIEELDNLFIITDF